MQKKIGLVPNDEQNMPNMADENKGIYAIPKQNSNIPVCPAPDPSNTATSVRPVHTRSTPPLFTTEGHYVTSRAFRQAGLVVVDEQARPILDGSTIDFHTLAHLSEVMSQGCEWTQQREVVWLADDQKDNFLTDVMRAIEGVYEKHKIVRTNHNSTTQNTHQINSLQTSALKDQQATTPTERILFNTPSVDKDRKKTETDRRTEDEDTEELEEVEEQDKSDSKEKHEEIDYSYHSDDDRNSDEIRLLDALAAYPNPEEDEIEEIEEVDEEQDEEDEDRSLTRRDTNVPDRAMVFVREVDSLTSTHTYQDSGASQYICRDQSLMTNMTNVRTVKFKTGNGDREIEKAGIMQMARIDGQSKHHVLAKTAYYDPSMPINIAPTGPMDHFHNRAIIHQNGQMFILKKPVRLDTKDILVRGRLTKSLLYRWDTKNDKPLPVNRKYVPSGVPKRERILGWKGREAP